MKQSTLFFTIHLPEHSDKLRGEKLWPQSFDLSNISQQPQHVAMEFLFVWKLLEEGHTITDENTLNDTSIAQVKKDTNNAAGALPEHA